MNIIMNKTLGITYSREGSYADPEDITIDSKSVNIISRDLCSGAEKYSISNSNSSSWASALILAAETALRNENYDASMSSRNSRNPT